MIMTMEKVPLVCSGSSRRNVIHVRVLEVPWNKIYWGEVSEL